MFLVYAKIPPPDPSLGDDCPLEASLFFFNFRELLLLDLLLDFDLPVVDSPPPPPDCLNLRCIMARRFFRFVKRIPTNITKVPNIMANPSPYLRLLVKDPLPEVNLAEAL